jgi:hypothetical protein
MVEVVFVHGMRRAQLGPAVLGQRGQLVVEADALGAGGSPGDRWAR